MKTFGLLLAAGLVAFLVSFLLSPFGYGLIFLISGGPAVLLGLAVGLAVPGRTRAGNLGSVVAIFLCGYFLTTGGEIALGTLGVSGFLLQCTGPVIASALMLLGLAWVKVPPRGIRRCGGLIVAGAATSLLALVPMFYGSRYAKPGIPAWGFQILLLNLVVGPFAVAILRRGGARAAAPLPEAAGDKPAPAPKR